MDLESGVYIPCETSQDEEACLMAYQDICNESDNISVEKDETLGGLRLIFNDPLRARDVLRMRYVGRFPVFPLSTALVVCTDLFKFEDNFKQLLHDAMKDLGPVVDVHRIPFRENMPNFYTKDWKVVLKVPEKDDLPQFRQAGLPDNMTLKLPGFQEEFKVKFCCSSCKGAHTTWNCTSTSPVKTETQSSTIDSAAREGEEPDKTTSPASGNIEFRIRDRTEEVKTPLKRKRSFDTDSMAQKIGEEQVRSTFGDSKISPIQKKPKVVRNVSLVDSLLQKKESMLNRLDPIPLKPGTSSKSDYEITILNEIAPGPRKPTLFERLGLGKQISIDESAQVPTSSRPDGFTEMKSELPSTDENSDSNSEPPPVPAIRKSRKSCPDFSVHIPDPIREIVMETPGVLDVSKLEAFFNNVKKKSSPCMVARQYTEDVAGLKTQLQSIKDKYYHTPVMHSVKEKQFMKWFEPMLDRFDRMPNIRPRKSVRNSSSLHQA